MRIALFLICIGLAALIFWESFLMPPSLFQPLGTDGYSRIVSVVLFLACLLWFFTVILPERKRRAEAVGVSKPRAAGETSIMAGPDGGPVDRGQAVIPWFSGMMILYAVSVFTVGYFVSTFLFLVAGMLLIADNRRGRATQVIVLALVMTIAMYWLFDALNIYLPAALLV